MRKLFILIVVANGLCGPNFGQRFIPMNFTQPAVLTAAAGHDTLVCRGHPIILGGNPTASGGNNSYVYLWSPPDGLNDPTLSNPIANISESKTYMLSVTDAQGCLAVSFISVYVDLCLGIDVNNLNQILTVFPNPSNGVFTIQGISSLNGKLQRIEVINQLGQIVFSRSFSIGDLVSDIEIDTKIKEPGIYFLKISLSDRLVSQRLIVR
ncbi:MAG: T9SS C-terminal target domain-containing protein [Porphyromonadaceae bacterium]|nr:MAG: T9SS C-terminal target domain-containing protein [Porphyromonadaceae bacterium]